MEVKFKKLKKTAYIRKHNSTDRDWNWCVSCSPNELLTNNTVRFHEKIRELAWKLS